MSASKQTPKLSSLETFDCEVKIKVSKPVEPCNLLGLIELFKNEYELNEINFRLFCSRIVDLVVIPILIKIERNGEQNAAKPAKKNIIIHYDKQLEMLGEDCTIKLSFNRLKIIPQAYCNIFGKR